MSSISTHVLDLGAGRPAAGMVVRLSAWDGETWDLVGEVTTDDDGRAQSWTGLGPGRHRVGFETGEWGHDFYPFVHVVVEIEDDGHYHIPLLLSPFGYSTYRGS